MGRFKAVINVCYLANCMQFMAAVSDKFYDLAIVDPFYGIGEKASRNHTGNRSTKYWKNPILKSYKVLDDKAPDENYFKELFRISKNQIIWGGNNFTEYLYRSTGWIVWDKKVDIKESLSMCELAWTSFQKKCNKFEYLWAGCRKQKKEYRIHLMQKPVALYKWILQHYAQPGWKIFDSHVGSGSIRIACHDMGFNFEGCEIDQDYWQAQEDRFKAYVAQQELFAKDEIQGLIFKEGR